MKLYYFDVAPNPTRVKAYVEEKGIDLEWVVVNLLEKEHLSSEHLARNPAGVLPVLELDSGEYLTESLTIIEYLEELYPEPVMIGRDPLERARTRSVERRVEMGVLLPIARMVHATNSPLGLPPSPELVSRERERLEPALERLAIDLAAEPFALGEQPTIVDCTLYAGLQFGEFFGLDVPMPPKLARWYEHFKQRRTG